jgi:hypothetical protein
MESSVYHPSPPDTYSYAQEENLGSTRKFVENYLSFWRETSQSPATLIVDQPTNERQPPTEELKYSRNRSVAKLSPLWQQTNWWRR